MNMPKHRRELVLLEDPAERKRFLFDQEVTVRHLRKFLSDFFANELVAYKKSEPEPEQDWKAKGVVKTLVGTSFDRIVLNPKKDVLVMFYAPWCEYSRNLLPEYDKLAKEVENVDTLVLAKMNCQVNECPRDLHIQGYPSIFLFPGGSRKRRPYAFSGDREVDDMLRWLKQKCTYRVPVTALKEEDNLKDEL